MSRGIRAKGLSVCYDDSMKLSAATRKISRPSHASPARMNKKDS